MGKKKFWTDDKIAKVRELAPRMSASLIADEVGAASRQAVIGIANRNGIELTGGYVHHRDRHSAARDPDSVAGRGKNTQRAERIVKAADDIKRNAWVIEELVMTQTPPQEFRSWDGFVAFFDLMEHHCRSIERYEGQMAMFCGRPKYGGSSWCEKHARRYVPGMFKCEA